MKAKKQSFFALSRFQASLATLVFTAGIPLTLSAADRTWTGATDALWSTSGNWSPAGVPGAADVAVFDTLSTANLATTLGSNTSTLGVRVGTPSAAVSVATRLSATAVTAANATDIFTYASAPSSPLVTGDVVTLAATTIPTGVTAGAAYYVVGATPTGFQISTTPGGAPVNFTTDGVAVTVTGGPVLTVGASGIDLSAAAQNLTISTSLSLGVAQTWNVQTGRTLTVTGNISGTGPLTKSGAGAAALNGPNNYTGVTNISGGTLSFGGALSTPGTGFVFSNGGAVTSIGNNASDGVGPVTFTTGGGSFTSALGVAQSRALSVGSVVVDSGVTGNMTHNGRASIGDGAGGTVSGSGILNITANGASAVSNADGRFYFNGDWSGFTGNLNLIGNNATSTIQLNINGGTFVSTSLENTKINLSATGAGVMSFLARFGSNGTAKLGELTGTTASALRPVSSAGAGTFQIGSLGTDAIFNGSVTNGGAVALSLAKIGGGTFTLTSADLTYSGLTTVTEGTLKINGTKLGSGATTVNGTGTTGYLAGTGSIAGTTTVASGGHLAPGDSLVAGGIGNITLSNLSLAAGSYLDLQFGTGINDTVTISSGGALVLGTGVNVDVNGFGTPGTYPIINYTGAIATSGLIAVNKDPSKVYSFTSNGSVISLVISTSDPSNFWAVDGSGAWGTASNWSKNLVPNAPSALAILGPYIAGVTGNTFTSPPTISLDDVRTVGDLRFDDNATFVSFTLVPGTSGSLSMDNGAAPAAISSANGLHYINAPVAIDAQGLIVDVTNLDLPNNTLTISGDVSGASALLTKTGDGRVVLSGNNSFGGGANLAGGVVMINSATSLGSAATRFSGGTVSIANDIAADARSYQVSGASSAIFDTNGFNYTLTSGISPFSGGTGGVTKNAAGTLVLSGANTYTGTTTVNGGIIEVATGGSAAGGALTVNGGAKLLISGGTFSAAGVTTLAPGAAGIQMTSGTGSFNAGINGNTGNASNNIFINLTGGTFTSSFVSMGRSAGTITNPIAGSATAGLYVNGATASITGALNVGAVGANSTASARIDSGSLTVDGAILVAISSPDRWSILDVNGGTFTSTNVANGVQIGSTATGSNAFLVRAGTATVERVLLQQPAASTETSLLNVSGGTLYVGSGGIVGNVNGGVGVLDFQLGNATLGAKAAFTSAVPLNLTGAATIKASDALNAAQNITLSGVVSGIGGFTKTGAGSLILSGTNTYAGTTAVSEGTLQIDGDQSGAIGDVSVASSATLAGTGKIGGNVSIDSGGRQSFAVASVPGSQTPRLITGSLTLTSGNVVDLSAAALPAGGTYVLATATGGITGTPTVVNLPLGVTGTVSVVGNDLQLVVSTGGYSSWAADPLNGLTAGVNDGPTQDPDRDGISNLLEFVLGGKPLVSSTTILPTLALTSTDFVFTFNRNDDSEIDVALVFQYGSNFTGWTDVPIAADSAGQVVVTENGVSADGVTVTIPRSSAVGGKLFGRLRSVK